MSLPETTAPQRTGIYADVRELIVPGFLSHPFSIKGARFVMRTLDSADWHLLKYRTHGATVREWKAWAIASSIWMANGIVVNSDEDDLFELSQMCLTLPQSVLDDLHGILAGLMRRMRTAGERVEAFCYESESRHLWGSDGANVMGRAEYRGLTRARNPIVTLWVYFNQYEDDWEEKTYSWDLAKFIAGPHAPKGIKKLDTKDKEQARLLRERRQRIMDRVYYEAKGVLSKEKKEGPPKLKGKFLEYREAHTEAELQNEMRMWVAGEKDEHDAVVDHFKSRIKTEREGRVRHEQERREQLVQAMEDEGLNPMVPVPLVGEAGQKFLDRMKSRMPGTSRIVTPTHNRAYEKYIKNNPEVGTLEVDEDGRIIQHGNTDPHLLEMMRKPDPRGSLQEDVENQRPTASFKDEE